MITEKNVSGKRVKINWLLILQGWAMLWVVIGHSSLLGPYKGPIWESYLIKFAYSYHMQLFILVSGWLFYFTRLNKEKEWGYNKTISDKFVRLLIPGLVFSIIAFAVKMLFPGDMSRTVDLSLGGVIHAYLYPHENPFAELWFIAVLTELFLLMPVWKLVLKNTYTKIGFLLILIFVSNFCKLPTTFLCLNRLMGYSLWFYLGILMSEMDLVEVIFKKCKVLLMIIGIFIYMGSISIFGTITIIATLGAILFSIGFALFLDVYWPQALRSFRNYTYQIFLMGIFAQILIKMLNRRIENPYCLMFVICLLAGLYVPVLVSKLIEKINWKPLLVCVGLKKK